MHDFLGTSRSMFSELVLP